MKKSIGRIILTLIGLFFAAYLIALFVFLTERGLSLWERVVVLLSIAAVFVGIVGLCRLLSKRAAERRASALPKSDAEKAEKIAAKQVAQAEIEKLCRDFLNGEGRLPEGFSAKYHKTTPHGSILRKTPFEEYLHEIQGKADMLFDNTGISDWLYFDGSLEINAAIERIVDRVGRHRKMNAQLREMCRAADLGTGIPLNFFCIHKVMIVMENGDAFRNATEQSIASCKAENISFCTVLSDCECYDLIEQKAKRIEYTTYPNYHDETYADWWLADSSAKPGDETQQADE